MSRPNEVRLDVLEGDVVTASAATLAVNRNDYNNKTIRLTKTDGQAVTLPPATGSGDRYRFFIGATIASVGTTIKVTGNDTMSGMAQVFEDTFLTAADTDTITFNGTTSGGIVGTVVELQDVALDKWSVNVRANASGVEITPFSATV